MKREVTVNVGYLYSLIATARDYGFAEVVPDFIEMLGGMREEEIEEYARSVEAMDGYTEEDYESIKETLEGYL